MEMMQLAKKKRISVSAVCRAVKLEGGKSLKLMRKLLLTSTVKQKRLERSKCRGNGMENMEIAFSLSRLKDVILSKYVVNIIIRYIQHFKGKVVKCAMTFAKSGTPMSLIQSRFCQ